MTEELKRLTEEADGMATYEYIVNNVATCLPYMAELTELLRKTDKTGQFLCSTARFLHAVDSSTFDTCIAPLIEAAIDKDRERRYIGSLLKAIWGADYADHVDELRAKDDNFRRIYKRIYPSGNHYSVMEE